MSENKKYTIVVKRSRVEVSESVYHAYHKELDCQQYLRQFFLGHYHNIFIGYRS